MNQEVLEITVILEKGNVRNLNDRKFYKKDNVKGI